VTASVFFMRYRQHSPQPTLTAAFRWRSLLQLSDQQAIPLFETL
jgi:hypothetical protein